jgi:hypothetical protein
MVCPSGNVIERSYNKMKDHRKIGPLLLALALALAAIVVFLTYPVYPFVIQHARRPPAP